MLATMLLTISCAASQVEPSEQAKATTICTDTIEQRKAAAAALVALGASPVETDAKRKGAVALGAVAAGCGEIDQKPDGGFFSRIFS